MDIELFRSRMRTATERVLSFTRQFVSDELPDEVLYALSPNASYDGTPLEGDETVYQEDSKIRLQPMDIEQAIEFLWRDGKVPEWINVSVIKVDERFSYVELLACGRFTASDDLYHITEGIPPFHVLSPPMPKHWPFNASTEECLERFGKFHIDSVR